MPPTVNILHGLPGVTQCLERHADAYDADGTWPTRCLDCYARSGGWPGGIPAQYGGFGYTPQQRLEVYVALARGDMSTALFITQHDGAVDLIVDCDNEELKTSYLPRYAKGEGLTTIGYSQLTTSRQGGAPALSARIDGDDFVLDGVMPWVTGALHVESVIGGAVLDDGQQVLLLVRFDTPGVIVDPPMKLLALNSTATSEVRCESARIGRRFLVAGPDPAVLARRNPVRALLVSATGIGLAGSMIARIGELEATSSLLGLEIQPQLQGRLDSLAGRLTTCAQGSSVDKQAIDTLRADVNDLLVRLSGVLMLFAKGTGFRSISPAQRLLREAAFFCVWSASDDIRRQTLSRLMA